MLLKSMSGMLGATLGTALLAGSAWAQAAIENTVKVEPGGLYEVVYNPKDQDIYIAATGPRGGAQATVVRMDGKTLAREQAFDVAAHPLYGLALDRTNQVLWGTDTRGGEVAALDVATGKVLGVVKHGDKAHVRQIAVDEANNRVYVSVVGAFRGSDIPSQIWVIDAQSKKLIRTIDVAGQSLTGLALDTANGRLFSTDMTNNEAVVIDLKTDKVAHRWPTGGDSAINVAYDRAGERLFVTNQGSGTLTVMNANDGSVIRQVPTGEGALTVQHDPERGNIYVANRRAGTLSVVDAKTYDVTANLKVGTLPQTIEIDRATGTVYVTSKARGAPRDAPAGTPAPVDATGDVVTIVRP